MAVTTNARMRPSIEPRPNRSASASAACLVASSRREAMTPLRWNWSANTRGSLKPGCVSDLASPLSAAHTYEVALAAPMAASSVPWPPLCRGLQRGVWLKCTRGASRAPAGPLGRQLTDTLGERSPPPSPSWAGRDGEGRSGSKGGEGPARDGNRSRCLSARSGGSIVASSL
jgi:hypothetical protein